MKGPTLLVIGSLVFVGVVAYTVHKRKKDRARFASTPEAVIGHPNSDMPHNFASASDLRTGKETVVASIQERHREAAETLENSLNTIFNDSDSDDVVSDNSETLERIGNGFNDILK